MGRVMVTPPPRPGCDVLSHQNFSIARASGGDCSACTARGSIINSQDWPRELPFTSSTEPARASAHRRLGHRASPLRKSSGFEGPNAPSEGAGTIAEADFERSEMRISSGGTGHDGSGRTFHAFVRRAPRSPAISSSAQDPHLPRFERRFIDYVRQSNLASHDTLRNVINTPPSIHPSTTRSTPRWEVNVVDLHD